MNSEVAAGMRDIDEAHVGLRVLAVGDDAAVLDAADQLCTTGWSVHITAKP